MVKRKYPGSSQKYKALDKNWDNHRDLVALLQTQRHLQPGSWLAGQPARIELERSWFVSFQMVLTSPSYGLILMRGIAAQLTEAG